MRLRQDNLSWQQLGDEIVVLDLDGSAYFRLNGSGALLWQALAEGADRDDLVAVLTDHYDDLDADQAAADVEAFLEGLREQGFLESPSGTD